MNRFESIISVIRTCKRPPRETRLYPNPGGRTPNRFYLAAAKTSYAGTWNGPGRPAQTSFFTEETCVTFPLRKTGTWPWSSFGSFRFPGMRCLVITIGIIQDRMGGRPCENGNSPSSAPSLGISPLCGVNEYKVSAFWEWITAVTF